MSSLRVLRRPGKPHLARHKFDTADGPVSIWRCDWPEYGCEFARVGTTPAKAYAAAQIVAMRWQQVMDRVGKPQYPQDVADARRYFDPYPPRPDAVVPIEQHPASRPWWRRVLNKI